MKVSVQVGHRVQGERDVKSKFVGLPGGGLHADTGRHAADHDLGRSGLSKQRLQTGVGKRAPSPLGYDPILRPLVQLRRYVGEAG